MGRYLKTALPVIVALAAAALVFFFAYRYDNKYTAPGTQPIGGLLYLNDGQDDAAAVHYLVYEWEYYPGRLLTPADFEGQDRPQPEQYVFIGQYSTMAAGDENRSPHGYASYRLCILLPAETRTYSLQMPDIYDAYQLYINGKPALRMGQPDAAQYSSAMGERVVSFEAAGEVDLLVAVSSQEYITAGMTHPPAFGSEAAVRRTHTASLAVQSAVCAVALLLGLMFLYIRLSAGYRLGTLFSLLCLSFLVFAGIPLLRALAPLPLQPLGTVYLLGHYGMFLLILLLQAALYNFPARLRRAMAGVGAGVMVLAVALSLFGVPGLAQIQLFSAVSGAYKWAMVVLMLVCAVYATLRELRLAAPVLCAAAFFGFALMADRLLPVFEPIYTGWFAEIAGFLVICILGVALWRDMAGALREQAAYGESLRQAQQRLEMQRRHYAELDEQLDKVKALRHDFRQQAILLDEYAQKGDLAGLRRYLGGYTEAAELDVQVQYAGNETLNIITRYYAGLCRAEHIAFEAEYALPAALPLADHDISVVLGNLLENALEACRRMAPDATRFIRVGGRLRGPQLVLTVENSCPPGARPARAGLFTSSKPEGGQGLRSVRTTAARYGGAATFDLDHAAGVFRALVTLPCPPADAASPG